MSYATQSYNLTTASDFFKRVYHGADLTPQMERDTKFTKLVSKERTGQGQGIVIPINTTLPAGNSATASRAVANAYSSRGKAWLLTTKNYYARIDLDAKAMAASKVEVASYLSARKKEADEKLATMGMDLERALWGDSTGLLSVIDVLGGTATTRIFTIAAEDAYLFFPNQTLFFADAADGSTPRADRFIVTNIDPVVTSTTATVTATRDGSAADVVVGDFIFHDGNLNLEVTGIFQYVPSANPGTGTIPGTLNGVDRTSGFLPNLSGWRGTDEGSISASARRLVSIMGRYAKLNRSGLWLSYDNWAQLEAELAHRAYRSESASARFNTPAIILQTPQGDIPVIAGPHVPNNVGLLADMPTAKLIHLGELPHMRMDGGHSGVRLPWASDQDGEGVEWRMWPEFVITDPSGWGRFPIS